VPSTNFRAVSSSKPRRFAASSIDSARRKTYAGPEPLSAVTASRSASSTKTTSPTARKSDSAKAAEEAMSRAADDAGGREASFSFAIAVTPAPIVAGRFGMARITRAAPSARSGAMAPSRCPSAAAMRARVHPLMTEMTSQVSANGEIDFASASNDCGFTASSMRAAPRAAAGSSSTRSPSAVARARASGSGSIPSTRSARRRPFAIAPRTIASPMLPQPKSARSVSATATVCRANRERDGGRTARAWYFVAWTQSLRRFAPRSMQDHPRNDIEPKPAPAGSAGSPNEPARERDALFAAMYDELKKLAAHRLASERAGHTLQPTALVHEAFLRLARQPGVVWQNADHVKALAAMAMRRILIDHARHCGAVRRGGEGRGESGVAPNSTRCRVDIESAVIEMDQRSLVDLVALDEALTRLAKEQPRWAAVVELRYFGGSSVPETAKALGISDRTVELDWRAARAWLAEAMEPMTKVRPPAPST